jgi:hypothetical protein
MSLQLNHINVKVVEMPRQSSILDTDYEEEPRRKRLRELQNVDWFVACAWGCTGLVMVVWARIIYLVGRDLLYWFSTRMMR